MSVFQGVLVFFQDIGIYDVVLPFLLVFTLVYALLEKTRVFGVEKVGDKEFSRKNVNSMTAFCIAFFVIASTQLVASISMIVSRMVLLLILLVCFMLLVGSMHKEDAKGFELTGWTKKAFYVIMFVGIIFIFLDSIPGPAHQYYCPAGCSIWGYGWNYMAMSWDSQFVGIIVLLGGIIGLMAFVMHTPGGEKHEEKKS